MDYVSTSKKIRRGRSLLFPSSNNNENNIYRPFDINCLLIKNDKMIKDELMNISDSNYKIKNY